MKRAVLALALAMVAVAGVSAEQAAPPPSWETSVFNTWKSLHDKILVMAKDTVFPDEKLSSKPHPDSRTVLDEYRHVTIGLEMTTALLKGDKFDYMARVKADDAKPKTRASVVAEMEKAMAASYEIVKTTPKPLLIGWLDHQAEHYGKLVSNYRMNGVVPPVSRR